MKSGFTLVETICAITITILVLGIGLALDTVLKQKQVLAEQRFFETLKIAIIESNTSARVNKVPLRINFKEDNEVFVQIKENKAVITRIITVPRSIELAGNHLVLVTTTGFISPQTIRWYTPDGKLKYLQKFQLGWSGFKLEKENIDGIYHD